MESLVFELERHQVNVAILNLECTPVSGRKCMLLHLETYAHVLMYLLCFIILSDYCPCAPLFQVHVLEERPVVKKQVELCCFNDFIVSH